MPPNGFMPKEVRLAYDRGRNDLGRYDKAYKKLLKKGKAARTPQEEQALVKLVEARATLHSLIFQLRKQFNPLREVLKQAGIDLST